MEGSSAKAFVQPRGDRMSSLLPFSPDRDKTCDVDVSDLIGEVCGMLESSEFRRGIFLDIDAPPYTIVRGDRQQLRRLLHELISNALHVTPRGGSVVVSAFCDDEFVELEVADSSVGIRRDLPDDSDEALGNDPARLQGWREICAIVANHGGEIYIADCPDGGIALTVRLPHARAFDSKSRKAA